MHIISTNPDYPKHISLESKTRSKISTNNYNSSPSEDTSFSVTSEKDQNIPCPDLGEIAKIERQYWRESLA